MSVKFLDRALTIKVKFLMMRYTYQGYEDKIKKHTFSVQFSVNSLGFVYSF